MKSISSVPHQNVVKWRDSLKFKKENLFSLFIIAGALVPYFIIGRGIPDGLIITKDLAVISISAFSCVLLVLMVPVRYPKVSISLTDILVTAFFGIKALTGSLFFQLSEWSHHLVLELAIYSLYVISRVQNIGTNNDIGLIRKITHLAMAVLIIWGLLQSIGVLESYNLTITGAFFNSGPYCIILASLLTFSVIDSYHRWYGHNLFAKVVILILHISASFLLTSGFLELQ